MNVQDKFERVEALAEERQALQQQLKRTLEVQDLQIKQVSTLHVLRTLCWLMQNTHSSGHSMMSRFVQIYPVDKHCQTIRLLLVVGSIHLSFCSQLTIGQRCSLHAGYCVLCMQG